MKLLILSHSLSSGGAERVVANLANYWAGEGWDIILVTIACRDQDFYALNSNISRIALGLESESSNHFIAVVNNVHRILKLRRLLKRHEPDIAMGVMTTANCLLPIAAYGLRVPIVGSEHIHPPKLPLSRVWEWLRRKTYPHLDALGVLTDQTAQWLRENTNAKKVSVIPNPLIYPIPASSPVIAPTDVIPNVRRTHVLLAVGRLTYQKGFDILLTVYADLAHKFPDWHLVILGEGESREDLEKQVENLKLGKRVTLVGAIGNIGDWYEIADLYVMSSRFEGFGNTLAEALEYGVPSVSVDCDTGPRDIIRHEVDGLLVPVENLDALAHALTALIADKNLRRKYGERAVEARERFSIEKISGMWEALFLNVISSSSKYKKRSS